MLQARGGADLSQEPFAAERRAQVGVQHLNGHIAIVLEVVRELHGGHTAGTELAVDAIATAKDGAQSFHGFDHVASPVASCAARANHSSGVCTATTPAARSRTSASSVSKVAPA